MSTPAPVEARDQKDSKEKGLNLEIKSTLNELGKVLIANGVNPQEVSNAIKNPSQPIPAEWWLIIMKFATMGVGLSIDVAALTVFMKSFSNTKEKLAWLTAVPAMHFILPELSGQASNAIFNPSSLSFIAVASFFILIKKMHSEEKEEGVEEKKEVAGVGGKIMKGIEKVFGGTVVAAGAVSMDALAAGPVITQQSETLGANPEIANGISSAAVLVCTLIAIGLQKHKDKLLQLISEDKAETYGKGLATGAFAWFLLDCLYSGLDSAFGIGLTPAQVNSITAGLAAISPVASVMFSQKQAMLESTK